MTTHPCPLCGHVHEIAVAPSPVPVPPPAGTWHAKDFGTLDATGAADTVAPIQKAVDAAALYGCCTNITRDGVAVVPVS